jgi:hypothetical protein
MTMQGFCQKENRESDISKGCLHPKDYCPFRQACIIHYFSREKAGDKQKHVEHLQGDGDKSHTI